MYGSNLLICKIDKNMSTVKFTDNLSLDYIDLQDIKELLIKYTP